MGDTTDQLQPRITVQDLAVRQQPRILWPLSPCLYTCQETYKHHAVGTMLWVTCCGHYARQNVSCLSCHKEVRPIQEWLTVVLTI